VIREIVIWPDSVLARKCEEVKEITPDVLRLLDDMVETMVAARGAGLAAPQVGFALRLVTLMVEQSLAEAEQVPGQPKVRYVPIKLVNPRIVERSDAKQFVREGCLSFPGLFDMVQRSTFIKVQATDETGARVEISGSGKLAQALQHEIEHLDGVVFADHLSQLKRRLMRTKLSKAKARGMRYKSDRPEPQDFTVQPS